MAQDLPGVRDLWDHLGHGRPGRKPRAVGRCQSGEPRTAVGPMTLADAVAMATLTEAGETWTRWLLPMDLPLRGWPVIALDAAGAAAIRRGQTVDAPSAASGRCRVLDADGHLLA